MLFVSASSAAPPLVTVSFPKLIIEGLPEQNVEYSYSPTCSLAAGLWERSIHRDSPAHTVYQPVLHYSWLLRSRTLNFRASLLTYCPELTVTVKKGTVTMQVFTGLYRLPHEPQA